MNKVDYDKLLEDAGDKLGALMEKSSSEVKNFMKNILEQVDSYVREAENRGKYFDRTHLFSCALMFNPSVSEEIRDAAKAYLEADYSYIQYITEGGYVPAEMKPEAMKEEAMKEEVTAE